MPTTIGHGSFGAVTIDPERLVSTRMLVQANSGGGKSWMLRVLCERLGRSTPIIVLDWEGEFASLREKLDVLLVGREGEIPTAVATAGALATQILEIGVSAVIDLYDLNPTEKRAYVRRFLESLMASPKRLWGPRLVIVDEAHSLAPEAGDAESADAVKSLASAGRKRQFCAVLATQRLSKLHKDAAAECNNNLIGRTTLDVDQKRAGDVLGMAKADYLTLRDLDAGEFYGFGPAFNHRGVFRFKSADVETTHGVDAATTAKPPEPSAKMKRAAEQLRDLAERSKTEVLDLDSARSTIRDLRRQLAEKPKEAPVDIAAVEARVRQQVRGAWTPLVRDLSSTADHLARDTKRVQEHQESFARSLSSLTTLMEASPAPALNGHAPRPVVVQRPRITRDHSDTGTLPIGERKTLTALIQFPDGLERGQLTTLTGYKRSTRDAYIQRLRERGYIDSAGDRILATPDGQAALPDAEPLPTGAALQDYWTSRLPDGEREILAVLIAAYPNAVARDSIGESTGYKRSTRDAYLQRLGSKELVTTTRDGAKASDTLF